MEARESQRRRSRSYGHDSGEAFSAIDWYANRLIESFEHPGSLRLNFNQVLIVRDVSAPMPT